MKKLFLLLLFASSNVFGITFSEIKFGTKQMGDAQWSVSGCVYTTTCTSSAQNVGSMRGGNGVNFTLGATQYMKFSYTNTDPAEPWTITVYNANGTVATVLGTYRIINAGQGYFMTSNAPHPNAGNGTLWSTQSGMVSGSKSFTETLQPSQTQMDALADSYYSPSPIYTAGATYTPPSIYPSYMTVGSNPGTMTYGTSAGITTQQQTNQTSATSRQTSVSGNSIYIDQVGSYNTVTITQASPNNQLKGVGQQDSYINGNSNNITVRQGNPTGIATGKNLLEMRVVGDSNTLNLNQGYNQTGTADATDSNNHYQMLNLTGSSNNVISVQKDTASGTGHFMETTIGGNSNTLDLKQSNAGSKVMFTNVSGSSNTITAAQSGSANHYLETNLVGNGNSVLATQSGNTQNKASINITNAGGPGSVDLQQTTGANYNVTTSCTVASGCGTITIRQ